MSDNLPCILLLCDDMLRHIIYFLHPIQILVMSATCKTLLKLRPDDRNLLDFIKCDNIEGVRNSIMIEGRIIFFGIEPGLAGKSIIEKHYILNEQITGIAHNMIHISLPRHVPEIIRRLKCTNHIKDPIIYHYVRGHISDAGIQNDVITEIFENNMWIIITNDKRNRMIYSEITSIKIIY